MDIQTDYEADTGPRPIAEVPTLQQIRDQVRELNLIFYVDRRYKQEDQQDLSDLFQLIREQGYRPDAVEVVFEDERFFLRGSELE